MGLLASSNIPPADDTVIVKDFPFGGRVTVPLERIRNHDLAWLAWSFVVVMVNIGTSVLGTVVLLLWILGLRR